MNSLLPSPLWLLRYGCRHEPNAYRCSAGYLLGFSNEIRARAIASRTSGAAYAPHCVGAAEASDVFDLLEGRELLGVHLDATHEGGGLRFPTQDLLSR
jgi:hypothetical protein